MLYTYEITDHALCSNYIFIIYDLHNSVQVYHIRSQDHHRPYHLMFPEIKVDKNTIHVHMYFPVILFFTIHNNSLLMTLIRLTTVQITIESE